MNVMLKCFRDNGDIFDALHHSIEKHEEIEY